MFTHRIGEGARTPNEHSAVPEEISSLDELLRDFGQRLLGEAPYLEYAFLRLIANFDIAVAGFRARGRNTDHHDVFAGSSDPDRKSTRLNSSHRCISYAAFCL